MTILALETSCDDTCAAVVDADGTIRSNVISSQLAHERFGGVVPEIASRHHLELMDLVVERALAAAATKLDEVELVAATQGPGLIGALLVGFSSAKALAAARRLPFAAIDHLQGHVSANFLVSEGEDAFEPPFLCLIASGGHTLLAHVQEHEGFQTLGRTLDDAAGEAFDKGAGCWAWASRGDLRCSVWRLMAIRRRSSSRPPARAHGEDAAPRALSVAASISPSRA